jgi:hypothetical protein
MMTGAAMSLDGFNRNLLKFMVEGPALSIARQVDTVIRAGYHAQRGIPEADYRALWGAKVRQFPEYRERFDLPLLVDNTMTAKQVGACGNVLFSLEPEDSTSDAWLPVHPETGAPLTRWIAFIQLKRYLGRSSDDLRRLLPDEVGLTLADGLHVPVQYGGHLREHAVDLCGCRVRTDHRVQPIVPTLVHCKYPEPRPVLSVRVSHVPGADHGPGTRGVRVIPVSW